MHGHKKYAKSNNNIKKIDKNSQLGSNYSGVKNYNF